MDRTPEFETRGSHGCIARMVGGEDLNPWPDLAVVANRDLDDIQGDAVEIKEYACAQADIEALIAMERRSDNCTSPDNPEAFY
jgi:hypothetical protein